MKKKLLNKLLFERDILKSEDLVTAFMLCEMLKHKKIRKVIKEIENEKQRIL